ncbi:EamA-like transporter [Pseudoscourfieldia marina]
MPLATNQPVSVSSATTRRRTPWRARILCAAPSRTLHRRTEQPSRRWNTACNRDAASFVLSKRTPSTRSSRLHLCRATKPQQEDGDPTTVTASRLERADADDDSAAPSSSSSSSQADCVGVGMEVSCKLDDDKEEEDDTSPLILVAPFLFWGTSMVAMRGVVGAVDPLFVGFFRLVPSGLLLALWAAASGRPLPPTPAAWGKVAAFAAIDGAMFQAFLAIGLTRINAGLGSVIIDSQPITVCVLAALLFGERLGTTGILGLGVGVAGLGLLEVPPETFGLAPAVVDVSPTIQSVPLEDGALSGEALMFLAAQSMAVGTVMVRWVCEDVDPVVATGWHLIIGGIPLLVAAALREPHLAEQISTLDISQWAALCYSTLFGGAFAYAIYFDRANSSVGALTKLSSLTFLTPVFAASAGYVVLGEQLTPLQLAGAAVTLLGVLLVNRKESSESS